MRVEHPSKQIEAAIHDVDEHGGVPAYLHEGKDDVDRDQDREDDVAEPREAARDVSRVHIVTTAVRTKGARRFHNDRKLRGHCSSLSVGLGASSATAPPGSQISPSGALPGTSVLRIVRM